MEKALSLGIIIFLTGMITPIVWSIIKKRQVKKESKMNKNDFVICYSTTWVVVMIVTSAVLATIVILLNVFDGFPTKTQFWATNICIIPLIVFFIFGAFALAREKIVIKEDNILIIPILGRKKNCTFSDITKLKEREWNSRGMIFYSYGIYTTKKICSITDSIPGANLFLQIICEKGIYIETIDDQIKNQKEKKKKKKDKF